MRLVKMATAYLGRRLLKLELYIPPNANAIGTSMLAYKEINAACKDGYRLFGPQASLAGVKVASLSIKTRPQCKRKLILHLELSLGPS